MSEPTQIGELLPAILLDIRARMEGRQSRHDHRAGVLAAVGEEYERQTGKPTSNSRAVRNQQRTLFRT